MWHLLAALVMVMVGVVQVLPVAVAFAPSLSQRFYGVALGDETTALLMRHRAILLALVGVLLFAGAAVPSLRVAALGLALASKLSYVALLALGPKVTAEAVRVARVDMITASLLLVAATAFWLGSPGR